MERDLNLRIAVSIVPFQLTRSRGAWHAEQHSCRAGGKFQLTRSRGAWLWAPARRTKSEHFNSHAHVERDHSGICGFSYHSHFNSHAHVERDQAMDIHADCDYNFNSHAHVERDLRRNDGEWQYCSFQLTRSRGAWPFYFCGDVFFGKFQLTRSRGAWPNDRVGLVKGFTFQLTRSRGAWPHLPQAGRLSRSHFNSHAHVERDAIQRMYDGEPYDFNSHAHVERDYQHLTLLSQFDISTHTLTWSVTSRD